MVTAVYADQAKASAAIHELIDAHVPVEQISVVVNDQRGGRSGRDVEVEHRTGIAAGGVLGGALGATLGGVGATLVATGVLAAPGLGLLAAGPLLATLQGAAVGAGSGGVLGMLGGSAIGRTKPTWTRKIWTTAWH